MTMNFDANEVVWTNIENINRRLFKKRSMFCVKHELHINYGFNYL
jgi:hypothetical protein